MSGSLKNIYAPTPATTRGKPVALGVDPKGQKFLYAIGNSIVIRDIRNPLQCDIYYEHPAQTTVAKYSPSGFYIASADVTGTLRIWDTTQLEHPLKIELKPLSGPIYDIAWSGDSQRLVVGGEGKDKFGAAFIWDSGATVGDINASKAIISVDFKSSRPFRVATGSEDMQVNWFEGPPFKFKHSMREHQRFVNCVRFSPDGSRLISVGGDKKGFFYDGKTGEKTGELSAEGAHTAGVYNVAWSPDGQHVLTVSADKSAKVWNTANGALERSFVFEGGVEQQQLGCAWVGDVLMSVNLNGDIAYLDQNDPSRPHRIIKGHNKFITALAYDSQRNQFYTGSYDGAILQWDVDSGAAVGMVGQGHTNQITSLRVQGDFLVSTALDDSVRVTPVGTREYGLVVGVDSPAAGVAVGQRDQELVIVATMKSVIVLRRGNVVFTLNAPYQPTSVSLSADETEVAVGGKDNRVYLYTRNGDTLAAGPVLSQHRGQITSVVYSPDGAHLASADTNREIIVWDAATKEAKITGWVFHTARVNTISWSPDGQHLASGALDCALYVWSVAQPAKRIAIKNAHPGGVNCVAWVDARTLASAGQDCTVKTWNIVLHQ